MASHAPVPKYAHMSLHQLAEKLDIDYYNLIAALCKAASDKLTELKALDVNNVTGEYLVVCERLLKQLNLGIHDRQNTLMPYLKTLHEKEATNHNCANCTGACDMQHSAHLIALKDSHDQITRLLYVLQTVELPMLANAPYHSLFQALNNEMKLIDAIICELLSVESTHLIPSIITSQKNININVVS
jgi:hypothetical protein